MSMDAVGVFDGDIKPVISLLEGYPRQQQEVLEHNAEIPKLVDELGSGSRGYRRHRQSSLRNLVSEIYSAPRVTRAFKLLPGLNLVPGSALDWGTKGEHGEGWDFTKEDRRAKARRKVEEDTPYRLIGPPSCTEYCSWQSLNAARQGTRWVTR
jgi:hypothetical protein